MPRIKMHKSLDEMLANRAEIQRKYAKTPLGMEAQARKIKNLPMKKFISWDGEGIGEGTDHRYVLLANSEGDYDIDSRGLETEKTLFNLVEVSKLNPGAINIGFALGYDINMILKDLPKSSLERLHKTGRVYWRHYSIEYRPKKYIEIKRFKEGVKVKENESKYDGRIMLWDVFSFFQSSFLVALSSFFTEDELKELQIEKIKEGKESRKVFKMSDLKNFILSYCFLEVKALTKMMDRLYNDYCRNAGVTLRRFDGVGSLAEFFLTKHNIKQFYGYGNMLPITDEMHKKFDSRNIGQAGYIPDQLMVASQHGYGGGHIEALKYGHYEGLIEYNDANSCYPSIMFDFIDLSSGVWTHHKGEPQNLDQWSIYLIEWSFKDDMPFYPFFYRSWPYQITYPNLGLNWIWGSEVIVAAKWIHKFTGSFKIKEYWKYNPINDVKPYAFIKDLYERRRQLKAMGHGMNIVFKLAYNSFYGKTVQHLGYEDHLQKGDLGWRPPFFQLQFGGKTTSGARAKLLDAAMQSPGDVIAFATDGFWSVGHHELDQGDDLGQWEYEELSDITLVQSGVYWYTKNNGKVVEHYRGFDKGALQRQSVIDAWNKTSRCSATPYLEIDSTRFITLGLGLQLKDWSLWHTWHKASRRLSLYPKPNGKRLDFKDQSLNPSQSLVSTKANSTLVLLDRGHPVISEPFPLPWGNERIKLNEMLESHKLQRELDDAVEEEE